LSGLVDRQWSVVDLTADLSLKDGRIDESRFGMRVARRVTARAIFDEYPLDALAGNVRQLMLVNEGLLSVLRLRRIGEGASERQCGDKQRTEDAFHGDSIFGGRMRDQALPCERRSHSSKAMQPASGSSGIVMPEITSAIIKLLSPMRTELPIASQFMRAGAPVRWIVAHYITCECLNRKYPPV
jgi:hypothetical protein